MNVIGYKDTSTKRMRHWLSMIESKKSYNTFRYSLGDQEQTIADQDQRMYNYYLGNYIQEEKVA